MTQTSEIISRALDLGGRRWQKASHDRIYLSLEDLGIIHVTRYGSGNVASARWAEGVAETTEISNTAAASVLAARCYVDATTGRLVVDAMGKAELYATAIRQAIMARLEVTK